MPEQPYYGGQAVIEGVMIRGREHMAVAVRRTTNQEIVVYKEPVKALTNRYPILNRPFIRGFLALIDTLILGIKALNFSAKLAMEDVAGKSVSSTTVALPLILGLILGLGLFVVLPNFVAGKMHLFSSNFIVLNLFDGALRVFIFLLYVLAISALADIQRIFQYHGAEHKVVNSFEHSDELCNANRHSTLHLRCGTNFVMLVLLVSIFAFSLLRWSSIYERIILRLLLFPIIASICYEIIRLAAKFENSKLIAILVLPGLWLQKLTTREPSPQQIEVAQAALNSVLELEA